MRAVVVLEDAEGVGEAWKATLVFVWLCAEIDDGLGANTPQTNPSTTKHAARKSQASLPPSTGGSWENSCPLGSWVTSRGSGVPVSARRIGSGSVLLFVVG